MSGFYGEVDNAPAGYGQGNSGFSGTPLWKLKQHGLVQGPNVRAVATKEDQEREKQLEALQVANVLVDCASLGTSIPSAPAKAAAKPLVRHVIIKDLRKVATRSKLSLPSSGLFKDNAPVALFAMFDGQSCADPSSSLGLAAEWSCKHAHVKLIRNLMALPPEQVNQTFLKATLIKTFEDLDRDLLTTQPGIQDGCGAALALLVGEHLLTAVLGMCNIVLCEPSRGDPAPVGTPSAGGAASVAPAGAAADATAGAPDAVVGASAWSGRSLGATQGRCHLAAERAWVEQAEHGAVTEVRADEAAGAAGAAGAGAARFQVRSSSGALAAVTRCLGDRRWKGAEVAGALAESPVALLRCVPEVNATQLSFTDSHPVMVLTSSPVTEHVPVQQVVDIVQHFPQKPRAASGDIAAAAAETLANTQVPADLVEVKQQCTAVTVCLLPSKSPLDEKSAAQNGGAGEPLAKKPKLGMTKAEVPTVRLRHLLVRHQESVQPHDPVRNRPVVRSLAEAEVLLRRALRELQEEQRAQESLQKDRRTPGRPDPRKAALAAAPSARFLALCKELSECETAVKGGGMCGDLGWAKPEELQGVRGLGPAFAETARCLQVGQWSDLVLSPQGVHLVQRIA